MKNNFVQPKEDVVFDDLKIPFCKSKLVKEGERELIVSLLHSATHFFVEIYDLDNGRFNIFFWDIFCALKKSIKEPFSLVFKPFKGEGLKLNDFSVAVYPGLEQKGG